MKPIYFHKCINLKRLTIFVISLSLLQKIK